jgi:hypothetical protein
MIAVARRPDLEDSGKGERTDAEHGSP